jgi:hypothetical protein
MKLKPYSIDGNSIQGSGVDAYLVPGHEIGQATTEARVAERAHAAPHPTYKRQTGLKFKVGLRLTGGEDIFTIDDVRGWFNTLYDGEYVEFICTDENDSSRQWYRNVTCIAQEPNGKHGVLFTLYCADPRWHEKTQQTDAWAISSSPSTNAITPRGNLNTEPILVITPSVKPSGGGAQLHRTFVIVRSRSDREAVDWHVDLTDGGWDTAALVSASKMQADGDDVRVKLNGAEVERWFYHFNDTDTQIWIVIPKLSPQRSFTLAVAVAATGDHDTISLVRTSTSAVYVKSLPPEGIVQIDDELFTYTGVNYKTNPIQLTGCTRAAKGTSMAAHTTTDTVYWIEHEIVIEYGDADMAAPEQTDKQQPIFELNSTNTSRIYQEFADAEGLRGGWIPNVVEGNGRDTDVYTADQNTEADPAEEMGMAIAAYQDGKDRWRSEYGLVAWGIHIPYGVTTVSSNGEKYRTNDLFPATAALQYPLVSTKKKKKKLKWTNAWNENSPNNADTWEEWTHDATALGATYYDLRFAFEGAIAAGELNAAYFEVGDVTLTLDGDEVPAVTLVAEQADGYHFRAAISNDNTGKGILVDTLMTVGQALTIDCENKTATLGEDNTPALAAVQPDERGRFDWLEMVGGVENTLRYVEDPIGTVSITVKWRGKNN